LEVAPGGSLGVRVSLAVRPIIPPWSGSVKARRLRVLSQFEQPRPLKRGLPRLVKPDRGTQAD